MSSLRGSCSFISGFSALGVQNVSSQYLSFVAYAVGCRTGEPNHQQNPGRPCSYDGMSIIFHFFILCGLFHNPVDGLEEYVRRQQTTLSHTGPHRKGVCELTVVHYAACQSFVKVLDDASHLFWYSLVSQQLPKTARRCRTVSLLLINTCGLSLTSFR